MVEILYGVRGKNTLFSFFHLMIDDGSATPPLHDADTLYTLLWVRVSKLTSRVFPPCIAPLPRQKETEPQAFPSVGLKSKQYTQSFVFIPQPVGRAFTLIRVSTSWETFFFYFIFDLVPPPPPPSHDVFLKRFHATYRWCAQGRIRCHLNVPLPSDKWEPWSPGSFPLGGQFYCLLGQQGTPTKKKKKKFISYTKRLFFSDCHSFSYIRFLAFHASCTSSHSSRWKTNLRRRLWTSNRKRSQRQTVRDLETTGYHCGWSSECKVKIGKGTRLQWLKLYFYTHLCVLVIMQWM